MARSRSTKNNEHNLIKWILGLAIILAIPVTIFLNRNNQDSRSQAAGGAELLLSAPNTRLAPGQKTTVNVLLNSATYHVSGADVTLIYDSTKLEVTKVTLGSYLPVKLSDSTISADTIRFVVGSDPAKPVIGSGVIAQIAVRALSEGTTTMRFDPNSYISATENANSSVLGTTNSITFTIGTGIVTPTVVVPTIIVTGDPNCIRADFNGDGKVNVGDYIMLKANLGSSNTKYDLNYDGVVNTEDLVTLKACMNDSKGTEEAVVTFNTIQNGEVLPKYGAVKVQVTATHSSGIQRIDINHVNVSNGKTLKTCINTSTCVVYWSPKSGQQRINAVVTSKVRGSSPTIKEITVTRP